MKELIIGDPRVEQFIHEYDGKGRHSVILKDGYRFSNTESCQDIGTMKELVESLKDYVEVVEKMDDKAQKK